MLFVSREPQGNPDQYEALLSVPSTRSCWALHKQYLVLYNKVLSVVFSPGARIDALHHSLRYTDSMSELCACMVTYCCSVCASQARAALCSNTDHLGEGCRACLEAQE